MSLSPLFTGLLAALAFQSKDQPPITFRVEVSYIEVDAIVTDSAGRFVSGLTRDDFEILEEGKQQELASFSLVDLPVEKATTDIGEPAPPSDVRTNQGPVATRLYVLLLDDLHAAPLRSVYVKNAARRFIEQSLSDTDLAAVVLTSGRADAAQGFTSDRRLLLSAVDKFMGKKIPSTTAVLTTRESQESDGEKDIREEERGSEALTAMRTLRGIAESLARIRGRRKAIVYVSEGIDFDIEDPMKKRFASAILAEMKAAMGTANRANVSFYSIDPRGLDLQSDVVELTYAPSPDTNLGIQSSREELRRAHASLRSLADQTGGIAVLNQNDLRPGLGRIVADNSQYYLLGYYPTNEKRDGKYRNIAVRIKRTGLTVRARKGYVAPRGENDKAAGEAPAGVAAPLVDVLRSPVPSAGVPLRAVAVPIRISNKAFRVVVAVEIDIRDFKFTEREGKLHDAVQLGVVATDRRGKNVASKGRTANLAVPPDARQRLTEAGFRTLSTLELEPGQYQVGVAVREEGAGLTGSVFCDLELPKPSDAVEITGVAVSSAREATAPVMAAAEDRAGLVVVPTTRRAFRRDDELLVAADIVAATKATIDLWTVVRASDGSLAFQTRDERTGADLGAGESLIHNVKIPLANIVPGSYILELKAADRSKGKEVVHLIPFAVVGPSSH